MNDDELKLILGELIPSGTVVESSEWVTLEIPYAEGKTIARQLRFTSGLDFDYLFCLTCVDWKTHFTLVYHFSSTMHRHSLVIKIKLDHNLPEMATVSDIWRTAEFHEREVYDLFGIRFLGHPDLRRLFLTEDWVGWPLRKDYEDPVNMIKL
jgi:NADH:ubiquinone oxidoreductase subunit C